MAATTIAEASTPVRGWVEGRMGWVIMAASWSFNRKGFHAAVDARPHGARRFAGTVRVGSLGGGDVGGNGRERSAEATKARLHRVVALHVVGPLEFHVCVAGLIRRVGVVGLKREVESLAVRILPHVVGLRGADPAPTGKHIVFGRGDLAAARHVRATRRGRPPSSAPDSSLPMPDSSLFSE